MQKYWQRKSCILSILLCLSATTATVPSFANSIVIGRYLAVAAKPQDDQAHLLQQQIQIRFPQNILTIKEAMQFMLQFSGYRLCDVKTLDRPANEMLHQSLPQVDRNFGPMSLQQALQTLAGNMFYVLADPVNRMIGFQVKPAYQSLYQSKTATTFAQQQED